MNKIIIYKTPKKLPPLALAFIIMVTIFSFFSLYDFCKNLQEFRQNKEFIKIDSQLFLTPSALSIIFVLLSFVVASIRQNTRSQPVEASLLILAAAIFVVSLLFNHTELLIWAHAHGYHIDHYESAHKGGWYIFKLTTPQTSVP